MTRSIVASGMSPLGNELWRSARFGGRVVGALVLWIVTLVFATVPLHALAQVTIGCQTIPDGSAWLQLGCSTAPQSWGLLNGKVALAADNVFGLTGNTMTAGMTVYNTATTTGPNGVRPGLYTWDGTRWVSNSAGQYSWVNSTAVGNSTAANSGAVGAEAVAVGGGALANGASSIALGSSASSTGVSSVALGTNASTSAAATQGVAVGAGAAVNQAGGVALGSGATVNQTSGVALGAGATANQAGGVALGSGSVANTAAGSAGYVPATATPTQAAAINATTSTLSGVSVGNATAGQYRQVNGVAAGTVDSDAVNVSQLKAVGNQSTQYTDQQISQVQNSINGVARNAYSGVAATTALTMIPDLDLGKSFSLGVGGASYKGYQAMAVGATARVMQNIKARAGVGVSSAGTAVGVGASYQW